MPRLTAPNGSTVNVSEEKAKVLLQQGYKSAEKSRATKSTSSKSGSSSKSSDE